MRRNRRPTRAVSPYNQRLKILSGGAHAICFYKDAQRAKYAGDEYRQSESLMMMMCALTPLVKYGFDKWEEYRARKRG